MSDLEAGTQMSLSAKLKAIREQALFCAAELLKLVAMISKEEKNE